jgi:hypothetical protein
MREKLFVGLSLFGLLLGLVACPGAGERCNPLAFDSECPSGLTCIYPTAPMCGVAYCCAVGSSGNVTDAHANCQPDPTLSCAPDGSAYAVDMQSGD